jgi:DNA modification methylase
MTTTPHYTDELVTLHHGDCLDVLRELPDNSVDAVCTDPPYALEFMGRGWDKFTPGEFQHWCEQWATECLRVLKPGGHLLAFGGSRTWHRLAAGVEDAGFEMRDSIAWLYGSGFPKSLDVGKAIDKLDAADERLARAREFQAWLRQHVTPQQVNETTGTDMGHHLTTHPTQPSVATADLFDLLRPMLPDVPARIEQLVAQRTVESANYAARQVISTREMPDARAVRLGFVGPGYNGDAAGAVRAVDVTTAHTDLARQWQGWGTALKPAFEPIVVARKPLAGTVAGNVTAWGTGALNIDACRVGTVDDLNRASGGGGTFTRTYQAEQGYRPPGASYAGREEGRVVTEGNPAGRWPTNVVLTHAYDCGTVDQPGPCVEGCPVRELDAQSGTLTSGKMHPTHTTASRAVFGQNAAGGYTTMETYGDTGGASRFFPTFRYEAKAPTVERPRAGETAHPTVKPLDLMRWLVRLVTPPGGTVLEPFAGSGTTAEACVIEGMHCIAIEREADYLPLIVARLSKPIQTGLFGGAA